MGADRSGGRVHALRPDPPHRGFDVPGLLRRVHERGGGQLLRPPGRDPAGRGRRPGPDQRAHPPLGAADRAHRPGDERRGPAVRPGQPDHRVRLGLPGGQRRPGLRGLRVHARLGRRPRHPGLRAAQGLQRPRPRAPGDPAAERLPAAVPARDRRAAVLRPARLPDAGPLRPGRGRPRSGRPAGLRPLRRGRLGPAAGGLRPAVRCGPGGAAAVRDGCPAGLRPVRRGRLGPAAGGLRPAVRHRRRRAAGV